MPTNDQDVRALVYLASRLRNETHGCREWDAHGTAAVFARELTGKNLRIAVEEVLAHACDPEAKTPAAIKRPFKPEPVEAPKRIAPKRGECCSVHPGQYADNCGGCRADVLAGDDPARPAPPADPAHKAAALAAARAALKPIPEGEADV